jgi:hypothetical protein
MIGLMVDR